MTFVSIKKFRFGTHAVSVNIMPTAEVILSPINGEDGLPDWEFLIDHWHDYPFEIRKAVGGLLFYLDGAMSDGQVAIVDFQLPSRQVHVRINDE